MDLGAWVTPCIQLCFPGGLKVGIGPFSLGVDVWSDYVPRRYRDQSERIRELENQLEWRLDEEVIAAVRDIARDLEEDEDEGAYQSSSESN